jgi:hypothetical protein
MNEVHDIRDAVRIVPDCGYYSQVLLRVKGRCYPIHWCDFIKEPCGLFPPRACPTAWEPQCWRDGRELLTGG